MFQKKVLSSQPFHIQHILRLAHYALLLYEHRHVYRHIQHVPFLLRVLVIEHQRLRDFVFFVRQQVRQRRMTLIILAGLHLNRQHLRPLFNHKIHLTLLLAVKIPQSPTHRNARSSLSPLSSELAQPVEIPIPFKIASCCYTFSASSLGPASNSAPRPTDTVSA